MRATPFILLGLAALTVAAPAHAQERPPFNPPIIGRWNITVTGPEGTYPSWLEVRKSGHQTLVGSFCSAFGSARPVSEIKWSDGSFRFSLPVQWEDMKEDMWFSGRIDGDRISGEGLTFKGNPAKWTGIRSPALKRSAAPVWGSRIALFNGKDLTGWHPRNTSKPHGWIVKDGILINDKPGIDLVTDQKFTDFRFRAEFRYPEGSNSGIYLRGRYEVQIEDNYGKEPDSHYIGGVYGHLRPRVNAAKRAGEWQTVEITLVGRTVSVVLNGELIIDRQEIPGMTGGALDNNEEEPGPILLQGDHGKVEFRHISIARAR